MGWGRNIEGQLGDGTNASKNMPMKIGLGYKKIAAGALHSLSLKTDGTLWAWGYNDSGQLGDGTTVNRSTPVKID